MIGQFKGRQKTNVYGWVSDLAVARSGFNQIEESSTLCMSYIKKILHECSCFIEFIKRVGEKR